MKETTAKIHSTVPVIATDDIEIIQMCLALNLILNMATQPFMQV